MRISDWSSDVCSSDLLTTSTAKPNPDIVYVLEHEVDGDGREVIAIYKSHDAAIDDILQVTENDARKAGLPFENELREKIRSHITRFGKFEGLKGRSYQEAALRSVENKSELQSLMRISY